MSNEEKIKMLASLENAGLENLYREKMSAFIAFRNAYNQKCADEIGAPDSRDDGRYAEMLKEQQNFIQVLEAKSDEVIDELNRSQYQKLGGHVPGQSRGGIFASVSSVIFYGPGLAGSTNFYGENPNMNWLKGSVSYDSNRVANIDFVSRGTPTVTEDEASDNQKFWMEIVFKPPIDREGWYDVGAMFAIGKDSFWKVNLNCWELWSGDTIFRTHAKWFIKCLQLAKDGSVAQSNPRVASGRDIQQPVEGIVHAGQVYSYRPGLPDYSVMPHRGLTYLSQSEGNTPYERPEITIVIEFNQQIIAPRRDYGSLGYSASIQSPWISCFYNG